MKEQTVLIIISIDKELIRKWTNSLNHISVKALLFFVTYFFVGLGVYDDYGMLVDDETERLESLVNYKYVNEVLFNRDIPALQNCPDLEKPIASQFDREELRLSSLSVLKWLLENSQGTITVNHEFGSVYQLLLSEDEIQRIKLVDEDPEYIISFYRNVIGNNLL